MRVATMWDSFRELECNWIFRILLAGDSACVVGVSGSGKSNLCRHIASPGIRERYLGASHVACLVVTFDCNSLESVTDTAFYAGLIEAFATATQEADLGRVVTTALDSIAETTAQGCSRLARQFAKAVSTILDAGKFLRIAILIDQFDALVDSLPPQLFANLRALRDRNKYRLSFVLFCRDSLPTGNGLESRLFEEFRELFSGRVLWLGPHSRADAEGIITRIAGRYGTVPKPKLAKRLIDLSGRHAGLIKAATAAIGLDEVSKWAHATRTAEALLGYEQVREECRMLMLSLTVAERSVLDALGKSSVLEHLESSVLESLRMKGLIGPATGPVAITIPLLREFIQRAASVGRHNARIAVGDIAIDDSGDVWAGVRKLDPPLTEKEFRLLEDLCLHPGVLRTKAVLISVLYQNPRAVSEDALDAVVKRLRGRLRSVFVGRQPIETVRGRGYRLNGDGIVEASKVTSK